MDAAAWFSCMRAMIFLDLRVMCVAACGMKFSHGFPTSGLQLETSKYVQPGGWNLFADYKAGTDLENLGACAGKMSTSVLIFISSSCAGPKSGNLRTQQCLQQALLLLISRRCRWKRGLLQIPVLQREPHSLVNMLTSRVAKTLARRYVHNGYIVQRPVARWLVPESFCLPSAYPLFRGLLECFRVVQALAALSVYLHPIVHRGGLMHTILWACELVMGRHFILFDGMDVSIFGFR